MIKRILVGLAGTDYTEVAVRRAVDLARIHSAEITGVTVMDPRTLHMQAVPIGAGAAAEDLRRHRSELTSERIDWAVSSFEAICETEGVPFQTRREEGNPFTLMKRLARFHDLTIFGLRSVFEYYYNDSDSSAFLSRLLSQGIGPIMAVSTQYNPIRRVLLAYSGSMESANTIRCFLQSPPWPDVTIKAVTFGPETEEAKADLQEVVDYARACGLTIQSEYLHASPASGLLKHAEDWDANLIVLGNCMGGVFRRRGFGNTVLSLIKNADRPLLMSH